MRIKLKNLSAGIAVIACSALIVEACTLRPEGRVVAKQGAATGNAGSGNGSGGGIGIGGGIGNAGSGNIAGEPGQVGVNDPSCSTYQVQRANYLSPVDPGVKSIIGQMTAQKKIDALNGGQICPDYNCDFNAPGIPEHNLKDFSMRDGPRGVHSLSGGRSTTWAVAEARAAAFDTDLEYRIGKAQGLENLAFKYDMSLSPTLNVLRHPGWARAQETYGEDTIVNGEMAAAFVRGVQDVGMPACAKHFAVNNTDENRTSVTANIDEQTLREVYTKNFQIVVEKSDPACIMAAYNKVNNTYCSEHKHLLTDILRTDWKWTGFVVSDWWAAVPQHGWQSLNAGLDMEMPDKRAFQSLPSDLQAKRITDERINEALTRVLNVRLRFKHHTAEYQNRAPNAGIVNEQAHKDLARESAEKGAVLLKNDNILPLGPKATELGMGMADVKSIIVMGPDALKPIAITTKAGEAHGLGDRGSSNTNPPYAVSFFDGIKAHAPDPNAVTTSENVADAAGKSVVIIPVTMAHEDEGEAFGGGGDRDDLTLAKTHPVFWKGMKPTQFINEVAKVNPNVIVLLAVGSAIVMEDWIGSAKGIVQTFYPGQEGGTAVGRLLFGHVNFSAKLPFTVAMDPAHYGELGNKIATVAIDYFHGYRRFDQLNLQPRFHFGYGLSYTTYEYSDPEVLCPEGITENGRLNVNVTVKNTGKMPGDEIVQLYIGYPKTQAPRRSVKELKAFKRVSLKPGESKVVQLTVPARDFAYWSDNGWVVEKVEHTVLVGPSADPATLKQATFTVN